MVDIARDLPATSWFRRYLTPALAASTVAMLLIALRRQPEVAVP